MQSPHVKTKETRAACTLRREEDIYRYVFLTHSIIPPFSCQTPGWRGSQKMKNRSFGGGGAGGCAVRRCAGTRRLVDTPSVTKQSVWGPEPEPGAGAGAGRGRQHRRAGRGGRERGQTDRQTHRHTHTHRPGPARESPQPPRR